MRESADIHGEIFPERFAKDLIVASNSEGKLEEDIFEAARELSAALSHYPWFIGVAAFGSRLKGYARPATKHQNVSDMDIRVYYDSSITDTPNAQCEEVISEALKAVARYEEVSVDTYDLDPLAVVTSYLGTRSSGDGFMNAHMVPMWGWITGPRVPEYMRKIGNEVRSLGSEDRFRVIDNIVGDVEIGEKLRIDRIVDRVHAPSKEAFSKELEHIIERDRKPRWREHIVNILGIEE